MSMVWMTSEEREEAREHADEPEGNYGFCKRCEREVRIFVEDQGYDTDYGFWSLPTDVCGSCGGSV